MGKIVLKYGLLCAAIVAVLFSGTLMLVRGGQMDMTVSMFVGYASMVLALLTVYFGIREHRETLGEGFITFGKAFQVGILIALMGCVVYVLGWEIAYFNGFFPDFLEKYQAHVMESMKAAGKTEAEMAATLAEMKEMAVKYDNVLYNSALTFMEIFPVALIVTVVSAAILRKRPA